MSFIFLRIINVPLAHGAMAEIGGGFLLFCGAWPS